MEPDLADDLVENVGDVDLLALWRGYLNQSEEREGEIWEKDQRRMSRKKGSATSRPAPDPPCVPPRGRPSNHTCLE